MEGLLLSLLCIAAVPTVLAAPAFNFGVRHLGAAIGTLFLNVVSLSVPALHALQGQTPGAAEPAGAGLVALGLGFNAWAGHACGAAGHEWRPRSRYRRPRSARRGGQRGTVSPSIHNHHRTER